MAELHLYSGGVGGAAGNRVFPSSNPAANAVVGYADHQRRRSYQVTRQLSFAPRVPQGGVNEPAGTADWCWYQDYLDAGNADIAADDYLNLILLPKNTRLEFVYAWVIAGTTVSGLTFDLIRRTSAATPVDTAIVGVTGLGATAANPSTTARLDVNIPNTSVASYLSAKITGVPASGQKLAGLHLMVSAEVVDWGSYDFNGNA